MEIFGAKPSLTVKKALTLAAEIATRLELLNASMKKRRDQHRV
ncbi:MAG: hypothetical protein WDN46_19310 [Methylocella sp.]